MDGGLLPPTDVTSPQLRIPRLGKARARSVPLIYLARGEWPTLLRRMQLHTRIYLARGAWPGRLRPGELA